MARVQTMIDILGRPAVTCALFVHAFDFARLALRTVDRRTVAPCNKLRCAATRIAIHNREAKGDLALKRVNAHTVANERIIIAQ